MSGAPAAVGGTSQSQVDMGAKLVYGMVSDKQRNRPTDSAVKSTASALDDDSLQPISWATALDSSAQEVGTTTAFSVVGNIALNVLQAW